MYTIFDHAHLHVNGRNISIGYIVHDGEKEQLMEFDKIENLFRQFKVYDSLQMSSLGSHVSGAPGRMCLQIENSSVLWPTKLSEFLALRPILVKCNFSIDNLTLEKVKNDNPVNFKLNDEVMVNALIQNFPEYNLIEGQVVRLVEESDGYFKVASDSSTVDLWVNTSILSPFVSLVVQ